MNLKALNNIEYGMFVVSACLNGKDNGCIVNTAVQVTSSPARISVTINKQNFTHDMILETGCFNVSVINQYADFELFKRFGFQSGKDTDKFAAFSGTKRSGNGILYLTENVNSYIGAKMISTVDLGTHTMFIADVNDCEVLDSAPSMTYSYYYANVKPKPEEKASTSGGFRCKICGYIYEGDELPADFVCPICKHGAEDFEKI